MSLEMFQLVILFGFKMLSDYQWSPLREIVWRLWLIMRTAYKHCNWLALPSSNNKKPTPNFLHKVCICEVAKMNPKRKVFVKSKS